MQMTCHIGRQTLQNYVPRSRMLTIDCVQPYVELIPLEEGEEFLPTAPVTVHSLVPQVAFIDALDLEIRVYATPIYNLTSLACLIHDVQVPAEYAMDGGTGIIVCTIPSFAYLEAKTESGLPPSHALEVEVSLDDGFSWSDSNVIFKFLRNDQVVTVD